MLAMHAAGATIRYCPVGRDMRLDPAEVERLCERHAPDLLYVIHYAGWPQPMAALAELCRRRKMLLVEDCALSLLSADGDRAARLVRRLVGLLSLQDAAAAQRRAPRAEQR